MFWHLLYHKHGVGTWARPSSRWQADHFWGPGKPWGARGYAMNVHLPRLELTAGLDPRPRPHPPPRPQPLLNLSSTSPQPLLNLSASSPPPHLQITTCYPDQTYLKRVELPAVPTTRCQRHLASRVKKLKDDGKWDAFDAKGRIRPDASPWTPHKQSIAPSTSVAPNFRRGAGEAYRTPSQRSWQEQVQHAKHLLPRARDALATRGAKEWGVQEHRRQGSKGAGGARGAPGAEARGAPRAKSKASESGRTMPHFFGLG